MYKFIFIGFNLNVEFSMHPKTSFCQYVSCSDIWNIKFQLKLFNLNSTAKKTNET